MIDLSKAQTLCSKAEWNLVKSSFAPVLQSDTPLNLKLKIDGVKELHRKCTDVVHLLHSESRITRTRQKIELFAETIERLEAALATADAARAEGPAWNDNDGKAAIEIPPLLVNAPPDRPDVRISSALARRGEKRGEKSGSTRSESHVGSIPRRQQGRRNSSKNH
jgi:hypothetical protein